MLKRNVSGYSLLPDSGQNPLMIGQLIRGGRGRRRYNTWIWDEFHVDLRRRNELEIDSFH